MEYNNEPYGNYKMLSVKGSFLAYTDLKRMNWYLDRDLADKLDDKTYQLNFVTKGDGNDVRGDFYKVALENKCVVCGIETNLTKHHVVPSQYRKLLPLSYKGRNSFDVVSICNECHNDYEREADKLKDKLLAEYGLTDYVKTQNLVKKAHNALKHHIENVNEDKRIAMVELLIEQYDDTIENILSMDKIESIGISEKLLNEVDDIEGFVIRWRRHFLEVANPQHISQQWIDGIEIFQNNE